MTQAPRQPSREAACLGKHPFATYKEAAQTIGKEPVHIEPYRCVNCSHWHVGAHKRAALRAPISKKKTGGKRHLLRDGGDDA
jgi:hypothetical protein